MNINLKLTNFRLTLTVLNLIHSEAENQKSTRKPSFQSHDKIELIRKL